MAWPAIRGWRKAAERWQEAAEEWRTANKELRQLREQRVTTETLHQIIFDWGVRCFGADHMNNPKIRALRLVEEAVEVAQAVGVSPALLHRQIDVTYSRPKGDPKRELGGVMVTTSVLCTCLRLDPDDVLGSEVARCLAKSPEEFAQRNQDKIQLGLDA